MGRLWNRLLSRSVAPMLIADVGGILPPLPKSPCPSAPNRPTSTTMRSQDPNRQSQSPTGPGSGAGLPQRQRHTLGHHAPSKIRGAPKHWFGHFARTCRGIGPNGRTSRTQTIRKSGHRKGPPREWEWRMRSGRVWPSTFSWDVRLPFPPYALIRNPTWACAAQPQK